MARSRGNSPRKILYNGDNPKLVHGESYTLKEYAEVAGVTYRCFCSRANGRRLITDSQLIPHQSHKVPNQWSQTKNTAIGWLESPQELLADKWLRKKL
tara:strand:- start:10387 stop:10680 length:294 start_codon:yes stop_codon:yes gene_type:complete